MRASRSNFPSAGLFQPTEPTICWCTRVSQLRRMKPELLLFSLAVWGISQYPGFALDMVARTEVCPLPPPRSYSSNISATPGLHGLYCVSFPLPVPLLISRFENGFPKGSRKASPIRHHCCLWCRVPPFGYGQGVFGGLLDNESFPLTFGNPGATIQGQIVATYDMAASLAPR